MQRHLFYATACALGCIAMALLPTVHELLLGAPPQAPKSLADAVEVANDLGLFHRYDGGLGTECLIVSESEPLPVGHRLNDPSHPSWIGTVAIYGQGERMLWNFDPTCSGVWGSLFLYGDPKLIEKLRNRRP
jgi:hypothetical protein